MVLILNTCTAVLSDIIHLSDKRVLNRLLVEDVISSVLEVKRGGFSNRRFGGKSVTMLCWNGEGLGINSLFFHTAQLHPL